MLLGANCTERIEPEEDHISFRLGTAHEDELIMAKFVEYLDAKIGDILSGWNGVTTLIFLMILITLVYPVIFSTEPDTHPLLLSRQSTASDVRQHGESAIYRSNETPHGMPLRSGLNIKEKSAAAWSNGKDGDLRDIWNAKAQDMPSNEQEKPVVFLTVLGTELQVEHKMDALSNEISVLGTHFRQYEGNRVAIYLPNCIEFIVAVFGKRYIYSKPITKLSTHDVQLIFSA